MPLFQGHLRQGRFYRGARVGVGFAKDEDGRMIVNMEGFVGLKFVQPGRRTMVRQVLISDAPGPEFEGLFKDGFKLITEFAREKLLIIERGQGPTLQVAPFAVIEAVAGDGQIVADVERTNDVVILQLIVYIMGHDLILRINDGVMRLRSAAIARTDQARRRIVGQRNALGQRAENDAGHAIVPTAFRHHNRARTEDIIAAGGHFHNKGVASAGDDFQGLLERNAVRSAQGMVVSDEVGAQCGCGQRRGISRRMYPEQEFFRLRVVKRVAQMRRENRLDYSGRRRCKLEFCRLVFAVQVGAIKRRSLHVVPGVARIMNGDIDQGDSLVGAGYSHGKVAGNTFKNVVPGLNQSILMPVDIREHQAPNDGVGDGETGQ